MIDFQMSLPFYKFRFHTKAADIVFKLGFNMDTPTVGIFFRKIFILKSRFYYYLCQFLDKFLAKITYMESCMENNIIWSYNFSFCQLTEIFWFPAKNDDRITDLTFFFRFWLPAKNDVIELQISLPFLDFSALRQER